MGAALAAAFVGVLSYLGNRRSNTELVAATQREMTASNERHEKELTASAQRHEKELAAAALEAEKVDARHKLQLAAARAEADQTNDRERTRLRTERFGRAADQMASDEPLVRMAVVYAMAALADEYDDQAQRQKCIDVLCGYMRLPPRTDGGGAGPQPGEEHVRVAIVDTIREHCRKEADISWSDLSFVFTSAQFLGNASFYRAQFHGRAWFDDAQFHGHALFDHAQFRRGEVSCKGIRTVEDINLASAIIVEGCHPTFVRPDGSTTDALPLIKANWDGTDPDSGDHVDVTDRRDSSDSSRTNAAQTGENKPEQAGED